ncbi:hypothetical protein L484_019379 [Morus notabilis]|uniref:Uncharacterized protein n=1 Tax=Morus notabilis TaxID=981085 RepID=W9SAH0_9ROSA|nr:hypothetical protein L484_019379 [Morus notabilis]
MIDATVARLGMHIQRQKQSLPEKPLHEQDSVKRSDNRDPKRVKDKQHIARVFDIAKNTEYTVVNNARDNMGYIEVDDTIKLDDIAELDDTLEECVDNDDVSEHYITMFN